MTIHKFDYFGNGEWFLRPIKGGEDDTLDILLLDSQTELGFGFVVGKDLGDWSRREMRGGGFGTLFEAVVAAERAAEHYPAGFCEVADEEPMLP